ncbi:probable ATP-dependent RNA helicase DDX20 isoform X2 [Dendronephthya gigantea]|nr:probable ATP-dependent RNA helicase DDX20 isoform X2 [Dendronephthya gigantea]
MCSIGQHLNGLKTHVFIGGMPLEDDKISLRQCHIAIGTPGRIKHLIESKLLQTTCIRLFILDEADKLLDESFQKQINWIYSTLPSSKQILALSATYPDHLAERLKNYMKDPTFVRLNSADPALEGIRHYRCIVSFHSLPHKVFQEKVESLLHLFSKLSFHQCLIFSNYQIRAKNLSETLAKNGWPSTYISGSQGQNERLIAMAKLKEFKCRIMISTDLTSRGIDAERVNLVINMDLPHDSETYLHRVGRAGRFGSYGVTVNFVAEGKEVASLNEIEGDCGVTIAPLPDDISKILSEEMLDHSQEISETNCNTIKQTLDNNQLPVGKIAHGEETNDNHQKTENRTVEDRRTKKTEENYDVEGNESKNTTEDERLEKENEIKFLESANDKKQDHDDDSEGNESKNTTDNERLEKQNEIKFSESANDKKQDHDDDSEGNESKNTTDNERLEKQNEIKFSESANDKKQDLDDDVEENKSINVTNHTEVELVQKIHDKMEMNEDTRTEQVHVENTKCSIEYKEVVLNPKLNGHNEVVNDLCGALEIESIQSDFLKNNITENKNEENVNESGRSQIIFRNRDADMSPIKHFNGDCFVSDESGSEYESSEENGSSENSSDSHVPLSCKDFDNVFDSYLKARGGGSRSKNSKTSFKNEPETLDQSLKTSLTAETSVDNTFCTSSSAINANEIPHSRSEIAQDDVRSSETKNAIAREHIVADEYRFDSNETSTDFTAIATNGSENLGETMFYGATPDDVTAYLAELPISWTNTWYRVYDRQTKFIMKYTKFSHENV